MILSIKNPVLCSVCVVCMCVCVSVCGVCVCVCVLFGPFLFGSYENTS